MDTFKSNNKMSFRLFSRFLGNGARLLLDFSEDCPFISVKDYSSFLQGYVNNIRGRYNLWIDLLNDRRSGRSSKILEKVRLNDTYAQFISVRRDRASGGYFSETVLMLNPFVFNMLTDVPRVHSILKVDSGSFTSANEATDFAKTAASEHDAFFTREDPDIDVDFCAGYDKRSLFSEDDLLYQYDDFGFYEDTFEYKTTQQGKVVRFPAAGR